MNPPKMRVMTAVLLLLLTHSPWALAVSVQDWLAWPFTDVAGFFASASEAERFVPAMDASIGRGRCRPDDRCCGSSAVAERMRVRQTFDEVGDETIKWTRVLVDAVVEGHFPDRHVYVIPDADEVFLIAALYSKLGEQGFRDHVAVIPASSLEALLAGTDNQDDKERLLSRFVPGDDFIKGRTLVVLRTLAHSADKGEPVVSGDDVAGVADRVLRHIESPSEPVCYAFELADRKGFVHHSEVTGLTRYSPFYLTPVDYHSPLYFTAADAGSAGEPPRLAYNPAFSVFHDYFQQRLTRSAAGPEWTLQQEQDWILEGEQARSPLACPAGVF